MKQLTFSLVAFGLAAMVGGCIVDKAEYEKLKIERQTALEEVKKLTERNEGLQAEVIVQRKTIESLQVLGKERMEKLFYVEQIKLGRYTGGLNLDGEEGDEGIKVYIEPIDQHGSVIKAAAKVKVQLYDLAKPQAENLIGEYEWDVDKVAKQWSSGLLTYHYSFVCIWKADPPAHKDITVRVEFTDYLTGKSFGAQKLCRVKLPPPTPEKAPETKPAKAQ